jgi:hypothetical protein
MGRVNPPPVKGPARDGQAVGYLQIEGGADVDICRPQSLRGNDEECGNDKECRSKPLRF